MYRVYVATVASTTVISSGLPPAKNMENLDIRKCFLNVITN